MKKTTYLLPIIILTLLSSCYDSSYYDENRLITDLQTKPAIIDEENKTLTLDGDAGMISSSYWYFQLSRTKDFSSEETISFDYHATSVGYYLGSFFGTYYYRLCASLDEDTIYAQNVETFSVNNTLSLSTPQCVNDSTYQLICTANYEGGVKLRVSTDENFNEYKDYSTIETGSSDTNTVFEYSCTLKYLSYGTTYYVKAVRDAYLGPLESEVVSFTTKAAIKMGKATYTGWDGKTYSMNDYDYFFANILRDGTLVDQDIEVYRTIDGWILSKDYTPDGNTEMRAYYSNDKQNKDNCIQIQTYKYDNPILMWGTTKEEDGVFNINLENMLSRVVLHFTLSEDYPDIKPIVNYFKISGSTLPTIAQFNVNKGVFDYDYQSFSYPLGYWDSQTLVKGETIDIVLYSIPCDKGDATLTLKFSNNSFEAPMEIGWESGNTYEYNLNVTANSLSISDVIVNQWQPTEGGSITINPL